MFWVSCFVFLGCVFRVLSFAIFQHSRTHAACDSCSRIEVSCSMFRDLCFVICVSCFVFRVSCFVFRVSCLVSRVSVSRAVDFSRGRAARGRPPRRRPTRAHGRGPRSARSSRLRSCQALSMVCSQSPLFSWGVSPPRPRPHAADARARTRTRTTKREIQSFSFGPSALHGVQYHHG